MRVIVTAISLKEQKQTKGHNTYTCSQLYVNFLLLNQTLSQKLPFCSLMEMHLNSMLSSLEESQSHVKVILYSYLILKKMNEHITDS